MNKRQVTIAAISSFIISGLLFLCVLLFYFSSSYTALIYSLIIALAFLIMGLFILKGDKIINKASESSLPCKKH